MNISVFKQTLRMHKNLLPALLIIASLLLLLSGCHPTHNTIDTTSATASDIPLITVPGTVKVYAYDLTYLKAAALEHPYELKPGEEPPAECGLPGFSNSHRALPLTLSMPEGEFEGAEITYEITVTGGEFARPTGKEYGTLQYGPAYLGRQFVLEDDQTIYWYKLETDIENWEYDPEDLKDPEILENHEKPNVTNFTEEKAYVDVIIRADGYIVGCMTLLLYADVDSHPVVEDLGYSRCTFYPKLLGSVSCPMQDGEYQNVAVEEIQALMDFWKQETQE